MLKEAPTRKWYNLKAREVINALKSDSNGLSQNEVEKRLAEFGPNELIKKEKISPWVIFLEQFKSFLIVILLIAVVLSAILGEVADAILIAVIVVFAAGLGFVQEYRAERAMEALKKMAAPTASVLRNGEEMEIAARELVPGDIILLAVGDRIPADARLVEAVNLRTDEAPLTGESVPIEKTDETLEGDVEVGDRRNMVFMGTAAVYGRAKAIVTATGMTTEFGKIAGLLQEVKAEKTPLQVNLDRVGRYIGIAALILCFVLAGIGIMRGHGILEMFIWGVALAVAAVPEALPAVVVISLALGVRRMVKRNALMRKLPAVETLGSTTFICSDKTGTLTQDQMTVRALYANGKIIEVTGAGYEPKGEFYHNGKTIMAGEDPALAILLRASSLCNDTSLTSADGVWDIKGDPTEGALVVVAAKSGLLQEELNEQSPRIAEIPFSSETKRMTTIHRTAEGKTAYSKGAPEVILKSCRYIYRNGRQEELTTKDSETVLSVAQNMATHALRVLGVAYRQLATDVCIDETIEQDMVFAGLAGMIDPPREEVKDAVELCDRAGIRSVMITGDHKLTAIAIAKELGIYKKGVGFSGAELDALSDKEFEDLVEKIEVYARVSPAHKLRVIEALAKKGQVVAMTGDGVNDAPALKKADIGVAMGITGTDVTKEAADMVLTDDNFASIVAAVEEGRGIFDNIKKYLMYLLSCNIGEILVMAVAILFGPLIGLPYGAIPLIAVQILFVNLVTDGLPAIALSVDPAAPDIMERKPRPRGQGVFTKSVVILMLVGGVWIGGVTLWSFQWALDIGRSLTEAQGVCFLSLILIQFFNAYNFRSDKHSLFQVGIFKNKWLNIAVGSQVLLMIAIFYVPFFQPLFNTVALDFEELVAVILVSASVFPVIEATKAFFRWRDRKTLTSSPGTS